MILLTIGRRYCKEKFAARKPNSCAVVSEEFERWLRLARHDTEGAFRNVWSSRTAPEAFDTVN